MFLPFTYSCDEYQRCIREDVINADLESVMSLAECKLTCSSSSVLWPLPREFRLGNSVVPFNLRDIQFSNEEDYAVRYITTGWLARLITSSCQEHK